MLTPKGNASLRLGSKLVLIRFPCLDAWGLYVVKSSQTSGPFFSERVFALLRNLPA